MSQHNVKLATLRQQQETAKILQAQHLTAAQQAHEYIHNQHHPIRVQDALDALNALEGRSAADNAVIAAILLCESVLAIGGKEGGALLLGVGSMVNQMVGQGLADRAIAAAKAELATAEFEADLAELAPAPGVDEPAEVTSLLISTP